MSLSLYYCIIIIIITVDVCCPGYVPPHKRESSSGGRDDYASKWLTAQLLWGSGWVEEEGEFLPSSGKPNSLQ